MTYDFETIVKRGDGSLKKSWTPPEIAAAGYVSFDAAEMDFATAPSIRKMLYKLADNGYFGFNNITEEYEDRVCWWMKTVRDWEIQRDWIVPAMGTIFSVATAIRMTTEPGESILVPTPAYNRYEQAATRLGRKTRVVELKDTRDRYEFDFDALEEAFADPTVKLMVFSNPHNPTGRVWTREELTRIAELSAKYKTFVFSDEIFGEITFDGRRVIPYSEIPQGQEYAMVCTSLGKTFNFTGVNHANMIIMDGRLRERFVRQRFADHYGSLEPFAYASVMGAYTEEGLDWVTQMKECVGRNREMIREFFHDQAAPGYVYPMEGTYVCWIRWKEQLGQGDDLQSFLNKKALLALEKGTDFGERYGRFTRMNLASTNLQTRMALDRLRNAWGRIQERK